MKGDDDEEFQIATGVYLDNLAMWLGLTRLFEETDASFRERIRERRLQGLRASITMKTIPNKQNLNKSNGELNMTNKTTATNKTLVTVLMIDQDENLSDDLFLVAKFEDVVCYGDDTQSMLMDLVSEGKVKELLDIHNKRRADVVDKVQQRRHGNKVYLEPIKIKDLDIQVK